METKSKQEDGEASQLAAIFSIKLAFGNNTDFTISTNQGKNFIIKVTYTNNKQNYFVVPTTEPSYSKKNIDKYFEEINEADGKLNLNNAFLIVYTNQRKSNILKDWSINHEEIVFLTTREEERFASECNFGKKVLYLQEDVKNLTQIVKKIFKEKFGCDSGLKIIKTLGDFFKNSSCKNKSYSFTKFEIFQKLLQILIGDLIETCPKGKIISDEFYNLINKYKPNVNMKDNKLNSPLHKTIEKNLTQFALYLINNGAEINATNIYARTPLHLAIRHKNLEVLNELIAKNADVEAFDYRLDTALHVAVQYDFQEAIDVLLSKNNVDVNAMNCKIETPIFSAIRKKNFVSYEKLIKHGAFVNISNSHFNTPLHIAVLKNTQDVLENLLSQDGSDINSKNFLGRTPIALAIESKNYNLFKKLKSYVNCDLHTTDNLQMNLLHLAVYYDCTVILSDLLNLEPKISLESVNYLGETPLMLAVKLGRKNLFDLLRNSEANINVVDCNQNTTLHLAMLSKNDEIILEMLRSNLSLNVRNLLGKTAIHLIVRRGKKHLFKYVDLRRCDLNIYDDYGNTALHFAINYKNDEAIKWLIDSNADLYVSNCRGRNSIHFAAQHGVMSFFENVKIKIEVNDTDYVGQTPLYFAVNKSYIEIVRHLLNINAKVDDFIIKSCKDSTKKETKKIKELLQNKLNTK